MAKKRPELPSTPPCFIVGTTVRVKNGTADPDFSDVSLGGWIGTVYEVDQRSVPPFYMIRWNQHTLDHMHPVYMHLPGGFRTDLLRVTADFRPDLTAYDPAQDADLCEHYLADDCSEGLAMSRPHKIWIEQCQAARGTEDEFGVPKALEYLIGEKFLNFLEAADDDADFRAGLPAFVAEIKAIFEPWQLAEYLEKARQTEPFDPSIYDDDGDIEMERRLELRRSAADLLLVERAREWLLKE